MGCGEYYWIGLDDRAVEGTFVWNDGSVVGFTNWSSGQPDDARHVPQKTAQM